MRETIPGCGACESCDAHARTLPAPRPPHPDADARPRRPRGRQGWSNRRRAARTHARGRRPRSREVPRGIPRAPASSATYHARLHGPVRGSLESNRMRPPAIPSAVEVEMRVVPRAGRSGFAGLRDGAILVRLAAAPVDGAANEELIALIARTLRVPKRDVIIVAGERARTKRIRVAGMSAAQVLACLAEAS